MGRMPKLRLLMWIVMVPVGSVLFAAENACELATPNQFIPVAEAISLYKPQEKDFRPEYDRDKQNQKRQTWKAYWGWINSFYGGNLLDAGWTKRSQTLLESIKEVEAKAELRREINAVGRLIAAEWSKDNGVRKIDTSDLRSIGARLEAARKKDLGSGKEIKSELEALRELVSERIGR